MHDTPVTPQKAIDEFLNSKASEVSDATIQNLSYRLKQFRQWCDDVAEIEDIRELNPQDCESWKMARTNAGLSPVTMRCQIRTFKQFVRYCATVGYCEPGLHERILVPSTKKGERARTEAISFERGQRILSYLSRFEWASRRHVIFGILWHTGMRMGSLRALDVEDVEFAKDDVMYFQVRHRPERGTPLKKGLQGERNVTIADPELASAIEDWIHHQRPPIEDGEGRKPLIVTDQGRASKSTIRCDVYQATQPCLIDECPHGKNRETCNYVSRDFAGGCPSAISPHPVRRSAITAHLDQGVPKEIVSERTSVNTDTLEEHYDNRTQEQSRTTRQGYIEDLRF